MPARTRTVPITVAWRAVDDVTARIAAADRELTAHRSTAALVRATQALHWADVRLVDLDEWVHTNALTSAEPEVLVLLHRVRVVRRILALFRERHADALRRGHLELRAGEVGHDPRARPRRRRRRAVAGAIGPGRR